MEWPHDPDGDAGSEGRRKYGLAVLAKKVDEDADFPLDIDAFVDAHGDEPVRINHHRVVPVADVAEHADASVASDITEFHRIMGRAMRRGGFWDFHPGNDGSAT
jgi:hypothetical protein